MKKPPVNDKRYLKVPCRLAKPTKGHRPAVWENMLGTVFAMNALGECRYFDLKHEAAIAFAGIDPAGDNRLFRLTHELRRSYVRSGCIYANPNVGKLVLWVPR